MEPGGQQGDAPQFPCYPGVLIKRVLDQKNVPGTCFIDTKTKADMFTATKRLITSTSAK